MKRAAVKVVILSLAYALSVLSASCTGRGDLNNHGIVVITTIDREEHNGEYTMAVGILKAKVLTDESKIGNLWISSQNGTTLQGAARQLQGRSPVYPVWYSSRLLLIGESAARSGLDEIVDYIARNREIRPTTRLVTVEGRAEDVLKVKVESSDNIGEQILDILDEQSKLSNIYFTEKAEFAASYYRQGVCPSMPRLILETRQLTMDQDMEAKSSVESGKSILVSGSAVYANKKLTSWLNEDETMGLLWLKNKVNGGLIGYKRGQERAAAEIIKSETKINIINADGKPGFTPDINVQVRLTEYSGTGKLDKQKLTEIEAGFEERIREYINSLLNKTYVEMKADPASFGQILKQKMPRKWDVIKSNWSELLPNLQINPVIKVKIRKIGLIIDTLEVK